MKNEKVLEKIKKCLRLAKSSNPHEAAAAMRQAQKLMEKYNLTERDVDLTDVEMSEHSAGTATRPARGRAGPGYLQCKWEWSEVSE